MILIAVNAFTGQKLCKATFEDLEIFKDILPESILKMKLMSVQIMAAFIASTFTFLTSIKNVLVATKVTPKFKALRGLLPIVMVFIVHIFIFGWSDWGNQNPGYVTILTFPVISLINSR